MTPEQFKAARETLGLNQTELGNLWGMGKHGRRTISRWENGTYPLPPMAAFSIALMVERKGATLCEIAKRIAVLEEMQVDPCEVWQEAINAAATASGVNPKTGRLDTMSERRERIRAIPNPYEAKQ